MVFDKENTLKTFELLPSIIEAYFGNIPEAILDRRRSDSSWTIREHLYHIVGVQEMLLGRMQKIKSEENPVIQPYFPDKETDGSALYASVQKAFEQYHRLRRSQLLLAGQLDDTELGREAKHREYTNYNLAILINHMIFHEYWHMYRIEELWLIRDEYFT
jgi:uncharacterized damage-inducible protein DinB